MSSELADYIAYAKAMKWPCVEYSAAYRNATGIAVLVKGQPVAVVHGAGNWSFADIMDTSAELSKKNNRRVIVVGDIAQFINTMRKVRN